MGAGPMSGLPPGFVLDQPAPASQPMAATDGVPAGFVLDQPSVGADVAKSAAIGVAKGGIGLVGLPGDVGSLASSATDYVGNKLGVSSENMSAFKDAARTVARGLPVVNATLGPGSQDIQNQIEKVTGDFYQPKTTAGEYAQTVGEFLPAALAGPEGLARKVITQAVVPGLVSEAAGQATKGTAAEPFARTVGALAGGGLGLAASARQPAALTSAELRSAATSQYQHPVVKALEIKPSAAAQLSTDISGSLLKNKVDEIVAPTTYKIVEHLQNPRFGPTTTVEDLDLARQSLSNVPPQEMRAAAIARGEIDKFLGGGIKQSDLIAGDAASANKILLDARGNYSAASRLDKINSKLELGDLRADAANSGKNGGNAIRQRMVDIIDPTKPYRQRGFSAEELAQLRDIVKGTFRGNTLRYVSNLLGGGGGIGQAAVGALGGAVSGGGYEGSAAGAALPIALGALTRGRYNSLVRKQVAQFAAKTAERSPLARQMASSAPAAAKRLTAKQTALLNALMASTSLSGRSLTNPYGQPAN